MKKLKFYLKGATCSDCVKKIYKSFLSLDGVFKVKITEDLKFIDLKVDDHLNQIDFNRKLRSDHGGKYTLSVETSKDITKYAPWGVIILGLFLFSLNFSSSLKAFMNLYMASFLIVFSVFKFWDLKAFKISFSEYDLLAKKIPIYGFVYPFLELFLGVSLLFYFNLSLTYAFVFCLSLLTLSGVTNVLLKNKKLKCACLGTFFNLPMSKLTFIENLLMMLMSVLMLFNL